MLACWHVHTYSYHACIKTLTWAPLRVGCNNRTTFSVKMLKYNTPIVLMISVFQVYNVNFCWNQTCGLLVLNCTLTINTAYTQKNKHFTTNSASLRSFRFSLQLLEAPLADADHWSKYCFLIMIYFFILLAA